MPAIMGRKVSVREKEESKREGEKIRDGLMKLKDQGKSEKDRERDEERTREAKNRWDDETG